MNRSLQNASEHYDLSCGCGYGCGSNIPQELRPLRQFVLWKYEHREGRKASKVPYSPHTGKKASTVDELTWGTVCECTKLNKERQFEGIGFVLAKPYVGIDLDDCRNLQTGKVADPAWDIIMLLDSYTELSPSKKGVHIIAKGDLPGSGINRRINGYKVEIYDRARYFTMTGEHIEGTNRKIEVRQNEVRSIYETAKPPDNKGCKELISSNLHTSKEVEDDYILEMAGRTKNGEKFRRVFKGDTRDYKSLSEADLALSAMIAFYTRDEAQIARLIQRSGLYREKWDREDYRAGVIQKAILNLTAVYTPGSGFHTTTRTPAIERPGRWIDKLSQAQIKRIKEEESSGDVYAGVYERTEGTQIYFHSFLIDYCAANEYCSNTRVLLPLLCELKFGVEEFNFYHEDVYCRWKGVLKPPAGFDERTKKRINNFIGPKIKALLKEQKSFGRKDVVITFARKRGNITTQNSINVRRLYRLYERIEKAARSDQRFQENPYKCIRIHAQAILTRQNLKNSQVCKNPD